MDTVIDLVTSFVVPASMEVLGARYDSPAARAMLLAIGLQESRFTHRAQVRGPARGFWQFERRGVNGVLTHPSSSAAALEAVSRLRYAAIGETITDTTVRLHAILEHNDVLAATWARLLLWTLPGDIPTRHEPNAAWAQYVAAWRPGAPRRETWDAFFEEAWARVEIHMESPHA